MFDWCKGSDLRAFVQANIPGATYDDWLEGWLHGFVQTRFKLWTPVDMLDIEVGDGPRPYLDMFKGQGARVESIRADRLTSSEELQRRRQKYGLVTLLSLEREQCLQPLDLANPLQFAQLLLDASTLLQNGGVLIWSHPYCFSRGPATARSFLEPAALFQMLELRDFVPMSYDHRNVDKVIVFHHLDTVFVRHEAILAHSPCQERVTRFCGAVRRRGRCAVEYVGPRQVEVRGVNSYWRSLGRRLSFLVRR